MAEVDSYLQLWIKCYLTNVQINVYELSTVNYAKCKKYEGTEQIGWPRISWKLHFSLYIHFFYDTKQKI